MNHVSKRATLVIRTIETPLGLSEIEILLKIVFLKLQFKKYVFFQKYSYFAIEFHCACVLIASLHHGCYSHARLNRQIVRSIRNAGIINSFDTKPEKIENANWWSSGGTFQQARYRQCLYSPVAFPLPHQCSAAFLHLLRWAVGIIVLVAQICLILII